MLIKIRMHAVWLQVRALPDVIQMLPEEPVKSTLHLVCTLAVYGIFLSTEVYTGEKKIMIITH